MQQYVQWKENSFLQGLACCAVQWAQPFFSCTPTAWSFSQSSTRGLLLQALSAVVCCKKTYKGRKSSANYCSWTLSQLVCLQFVVMHLVFFNNSIQLLLPGVLAHVVQQLTHSGSKAALGISADNYFLIIKYSVKIEGFSSCFHTEHIWDFGFPVFLIRNWDCQLADKPCWREL